MSLQGRLLMSDARESATTLRAACAVGAVALVVGVGAVPVLLAGVALVLRQATDLSLAAALITTAGGAAVVAAAFGYAALRHGGDAARVLAKSYRELEATLGCFVPDGAGSYSKDSPSYTERTR